jgi:excisionase family DNA binding protein
MKSERSSKPQHWRAGVGVVQKLVSAEVPRRVLYRVEEAVVLLGLSRSQLYELIRSGRLQTVTEGRVRLIPAAAIDAYVSLLTSEAQADTGGDAA